MYDKCNPTYASTSVLQEYRWDNMINYDEDPITRSENFRSLKVSRLDNFGALNAEAIKIGLFSRANSQIPECIL